MPAMRPMTIFSSSHAAMARMRTAMALRPRDDPVFSFDAMASGYSPRSPDRHPAGAVIGPGAVEEQPPVGARAGGPVGSAAEQESDGAGGGVGPEVGVAGWVAQQPLDAVVAVAPPRVGQTGVPERDLPQRHPQPRGGDKRLQEAHMAGEIAGVPARGAAIAEDLLV